MPSAGTVRPCGAGALGAPKMKFQNPPPPPPPAGAVAGGGGVLGAAPGFSFWAHATVASAQTNPATIPVQPKARHFMVRPSRFAAPGSAAGPAGSYRPAGPGTILLRTGCLLRLVARPLRALVD